MIRLVYVANSKSNIQALYQVDHIDLAGINGADR